jgi:hypothetical protein
MLGKQREFNLSDIHEQPLPLLYWFEITNLQIAALMLIPKRRVKIHFS